MARLSGALHAYEHLRQKLNQAPFWVVPFCEIFDRIQSRRRNEVWPFDPSGAFGPSWSPARFDQPSISFYGPSIFVSGPRLTRINFRSVGIASRNSQ